MSEFAPTDVQNTTFDANSGAKVLHFFELCKKKVKI